ncbi:heterogeneous nuclear ribonucleoprotein L-like [Acyrthosiphon pisum]|uniref:Heterogeneous nuclear ribonucleoprotein L RRM domain-containing protein n=1 Tax=Acyrthosiphon pisum TaxID=7029 RepID=A0A8R2H5Q0_ACYPI|nr:heterogeneous nuclear ribonucleoprotein L-like [Acyrthosiphon pisum]XP_016656474.1 heterogeneous nuclear ribonucleoprotein L-like [Acyrthosiphon pisum]XP_016656475.1 heterogeneous nuclear ribonucleoprotein L-like [Acyrthosiphon pisum]|eukprot:XP_008178778.2 PREDICTED: heterogeneous nuclear ribonucleoprotein L-like [Acyrthosiphon pisum]
MANNTWNSWVSYIKQEENNMIRNLYDGYKPQKNTNSVNYKHKSVIGRPNRVLHLEILRTTVKVTTHVLYSVLSIHGEILRIVIYRKFGQLRAFVEFSKEEFATKVFGESNYIILDYISLKAEYAKASRINVLNNDELTWDYLKSPLLDYVNGLPTLKSIVPVLKDSPQSLKNRNIAKHDTTWELVENYDFIKPADTSLAPEKTKTIQFVMTANSKTRKTLSTISCSEKFSILSVRGLDPAKSNCNRLFRLLSLYATVANINYSRELNSAEVQISKCDDINTFAQIQHHYLSHGFNLSFQYLKDDKKTKNRCINPFVLSDGSPSYVVYDRKMTQHVSSPPPSRVLQFVGAPPSMNAEKLISLFKRTIKNKNLKIKLLTPKDPKKSLTISGEIWFSTVSEAIEAVMEINYAIFWNKDTNKKEYVLKLTFISEVLPILENVAIKTENNNVIKTKGHKVIKTEFNKLIKIEDIKETKTDRNEVIKTEDYKLIKTDNNKRIKLEDYNVIETEDYDNIVIKTENNIAIKTEDSIVIESDDDLAIKTEVD